MRRIRGSSTAALVLMILAGVVVGAAAAPEGQMTWGIHISLAPTWSTIQQFVHDKAMFAPIWQLAATGGFARVEESGLGLITGFPFSGPYEDVKLRAK